MGVGRRFGTAALLLAAAAMAALLGLAACTGESPQAKTAVSGNGSFALDGGSVEVQDDQLRVSLDANPTTGYTWMMRLDGDALELAGDEFLNGQSTDGSRAVVGSGGTQQFTFQGLAPGEATVTLEYERPWEEADPEKMVVLQVTVGDDGIIADAAAEMTAAEPAGESSAGSGSGASGKSA